MKCTNSECGVENPEGAKFCMRCGTDLTEALQVACPKCGRKNPAGYARCRKCGYKPVELKCPNCGNLDVELDDAFCWKCESTLHLGGSVKDLTDWLNSNIAESPLHLGGSVKPYADCQVGEHFFYGSYPQGKNGEVAPIEWRVLARESDRLLVIVEYGLDAKAYNKKYEATTWSQCTLRSWLNDEFMEKAFSAEEQESLLEVNLRNPNSHYWKSSVSGGPDTRDKLFLLSYDEANKYFSGNDERCCKATAYAVELRAWDDGCWWWLRSPGYCADSAAGVDSDGGLSYGIDVSYGHVAVRPAAFMTL